MEIFLFWFFGSIIVGVFATMRRDRNAFVWTMLSLFISPLLAGLLVAVMPAKNSRACPYCAGTVKDKATVCMHCQCDLPPTPLQVALEESRQRTLAKAR